MAVKVLVSLLYCGVLSLSAGKSRLICQTQTIQRGEGVDVALQCRLDPPANLVDYTLDVTRADLHKVVHSYRHGKDDSGPQMDQYRGRTTLTHGDLTRGIITLQISSVQLNDSGPYTCFVVNLTAYCTTNLTVGKSRLICQTSVQREEGVDVALQFHLDPPANLVDYTLDVTRADLDKEVCFYRHGKDDSGPQVDQYRDRTTLTHEDLIRGIITLQISSVQLNDSGPYTCFVLGLKAYCTTNLTVGKSRLICPTQTIQAGEGDDVALQCRLDPPANLVDYTLDVTRADLHKVVHSYRHGKDHSDPQADQYRDRTTLTHEDLIRGIITLQISSVQLNDSGPYRCFVPDLKALCINNLTVGKYRLICPTSIQREESHNVTLQFRLDPPANLGNSTLDVTRADLDKEVCFYRHGKDHCGPQMDQYGGRTTLNHEDLIRGNITLQISSVQLNDSGLYTGFVPDLKVGCTTNLTVEKEDQPNERMIDDPLNTIKPPTTGKCL
ncbi:butyrophilin-like protein 2 [Trachinotus anak]|uniref:butyrophilin-like protein 2 n=1 Tax=Trachinotus anak TaxID=443729 RepID=UPI0039F196C0